MGVLGQLGSAARSRDRIQPVVPRSGLGTKARNSPAGPRLELGAEDRPGPKLGHLQGTPSGAPKRTSSSPSLIPELGPTAGPQRGTPAHRPRQGFRRGANRVSIRWQARVSSRQRGPRPLEGDGLRLGWRAVRGSGGASRPGPSAIGGSKDAGRAEECMPWVSRTP